MKGVIRYVGADSLRGTLLILQGVVNVAYDELAEIETENGTYLGRVIELSADKAVILVYQGTPGLSLSNTVTRFTGRSMTMGLSPEILGGVFDGMGRTIRDMGAFPPRIKRGINGSAINPVYREPPHMPLQTGFSAIDTLATLLRGQKLPIFTGEGLPHDDMAARIAIQFLAGGGAQTAVVFAAMGIKQDTALFFRNRFEESGVSERSALYLTLADAPCAERLITPRVALTAAEYLAFDLGYDVLVILTDMTAYAESLREVAALRGELPGHRGYPGYLYSDLASLYERAGILRGKRGSVTLLPVITMLNDDITHPVADLTGYITEGQIVLDRVLHGEGIYPPVGVLPSLSRLMKEGIGEGKTRCDHSKIALKLFAAYARVNDIRSLRSIVGDEGLTEADRRLLDFGDAFEKRFIGQYRGEYRSFNESLDIGLQTLALL